MTFSFNIPRWLRSFFAWRTAYDTGAWIYSENAVTGERRAYRREGFAYQPRDDEWLAGGVWDAPPSQERVYIGGGSIATPPRSLGGHLMPFVSAETTVLQHLSPAQPGWMR